MPFVPSRTWRAVAPGGARLVFLAVVLTTPSVTSAQTSPPEATTAISVGSPGQLGASSQTFSIGNSVEGRPIEVTTLGSGPVAVAFVGNIHGGWEPMAREIVLSALEHFKQNPQTVPPEATLYFVPTVNPDGFEKGKTLWATADGSGGPADALLARTAFNANGIDLNRNFPVRWSPYACGGEKYLLQFGETCISGASGPYPFSEPETLAYESFIIGHKVRMALTYHEDNTPSVSVREGGGGPSERLALQMSHVLDYPYVPVWTKYSVTGQAQDWLDSAGVLGVEVELKYRTVDLDHNIGAMLLAIDRATAGEDAPALVRSFQADRLPTPVGQIS